MLDKLTEYANTVQNTLYTGPNPPSPILFALLKLFVAALICRKVNIPICSFKPFSSVNSNKERL